MKAITKTKALNSKQKTNKILALLTLICLIITAVIIGQFFILDYNTNKILPDGTVINGFNVSGMSKEEANVILINKFNEKAEDFNLNIHDPDSDKVWTFDKDDFEVNTDIHTILDASENRNELLNTKEEKVNLISQFNKIGGSVNVAFNYIFTGLDEKLEQLYKEVELEAENSTITIDPTNDNLFIITESKNGKRVDKNQLYNDINLQFTHSNTIDVDLQYIQEIPPVTKEYNQQLTKKISTYTTQVPATSDGRKHNVQRALAQFNGLVVNPHEQISFNQIIGPHTIENGYKTATIIYNGEFTDGIGGGICQASSTLYNALLLAGLQIDEVHKHSLPVRYVPPALDAMVAEYTSDLKFTNNTDYPIYINTTHNSTSVTVNIYSHTPAYTYKTRSETIRTISSEGDKIIPDTSLKYSNKILYKGEYYRVSYPKDGYEAKSYLQTYQGDELIKEEEIRHEIYQAQKGVVYEGVEKTPAGVNPIDTGVKIIECVAE